MVRSARRPAALATAVAAGLIAGCGVRSSPAVDPLDSPTTTVSVATFGAVPDDGRDDSAALQRALDEARPDRVLVLPPGTYQHDKILTARVAGTKIDGSGAKLLATQEESSAFVVDGDRISVRNVEFAVAGATRRWLTDKQAKVVLSGHSGIVVTGVTVSGSAGAGILITKMSHNFELDRPTVRDTRGDGVRITDGAYDGRVINALVERSGDDGVITISYETDSGGCHDIVVQSPRVYRTAFGHGLSVVGGTDIAYRDIDVRDTSASGIYIAVEGAPFNTLPSKRVTFSGGTVSHANYGQAADQGSVTVTSKRPDPGSVSNVLFKDLVIADTKPSAAYDIGLIGPEGSLSDIALHSLRMTGGPPNAFTSQVKKPAYDIDGWLVNGQPFGQ